MKIAQGMKLILAPVVAVAVPVLAHAASEAAGTSPGESFPWAQFVSPVASSAMLAWYLWYDVSKARPKRDKEHREERHDMRAELITERTRYESIMKDQENRHDKRMAEEDARREVERQEFLAALRSINCKHP
jgi:flagellar biosynthesis/type III secretory pathway M-ring protein FliF/YscJ